MTSRTAAARPAAGRRAAVIIVAAALAISTWSTPPQTAQAAKSSADTFTAGTSWKPSSNARVKSVRSGANRTFTLTPKRRSGRTNVSMTSAASRSVVTTAGTAVTASARLRTSEPGRRLTLRILEVKDGRTVSSRTRSVTPSSRGWKKVSVTLRTSEPDTRIRTSVHAERLGANEVARLTSLKITTLAPAAPVASRPCQDIDYSDPAQGVRTFTEEFEGTAIDRTTWRVRDNTFLNHDQAWITKDAVTVHDGFLDITGKQLPVEQHKTNPNGIYSNNKVRDYSTGYIDTIDTAGYGNDAADRFGQKYGHFEVRAWVPSESTMSRGIWPAFWLRADHNVGEIDPMESYGGPSIRSFDPSSSYEWNSWADTAQGSTNDVDKQQTHGRADVGSDKIWQGWHTYGVNWSPGCLRYLYDGKTVGTVEFDAPGTKPYFRGPTFDDTFHIRLNMQVGSKYWGWADEQHTRPEFSYKVDWVRVHQAKELVGR